MCRPTNKPTFVRAVEGQVEVFVKATKSFSAHDVTVALRERVNDGSIHVDPSETDTIHVGGKDVPKIAHEDVKAAVHDIFHGSEMQGYNRRHNGAHWEYYYGPQTTDDVDDDDDSAADSSDYGQDVSVSPKDVNYDGTSTL